MCNFDVFFHRKEPNETPGVWWSDIWRFSTQWQWPCVLVVKTKWIIQLNHNSLGFRFQLHVYSWQNTQKCYIFKRLQLVCKLHGLEPDDWCSYHQYTPTTRVWRIILFSILQGAHRAPFAIDREYNSPDSTDYIVLNHESVILLYRKILTRKICQTLTRY